MQFEQTLVNYHTKKQDEGKQDILLKAEAFNIILIKNKYFSQELQLIRHAVDKVINLAIKGKRKIKEIEKYQETSNKRVEKQLQSSSKQKIIKKASPAGLLMNIVMSTL